MEGMRKIWLLFLFVLFAIVSFRDSVAVSFGANEKSIKISLKDDLAGEVDPEYVSFNFDWWPRNSSQKGWGNAGILNLDITNPRLVYLAKQLSPAHLRIGGTLGDTIVYKVNSTNELPCEPGISCLNMTRWNQIINFTETANLQLVFGLNERYGKGTPGTWDPSNTQAFLEYIVKQGDKVWGFELGNELNIRHLYPPQACAKDFATLSGIINNLWSGNNSRPKLIGPDETPDATFLAAFLQGTNKFLDIVTWHLYIGYGLDPNLSNDLLDPTFLDRSHDFAKPIVEAVKKYSPKSHLWVGETAAAYHSGQNHTTNAFLSGFWYLDQLGTLAKMEHKVFCRQTLVGGSYELLDKENFEPNPDYWSALLWKQLMGTRVLSTTSTDETKSHLRHYAHCSSKYRGGITLVLINLAKDTAFKVELTHITMIPRVEYHLTSDDLHSQNMYLNGNQLQLTVNDQLPPLHGLVVTKSNQPLVMQPLSYGFIEFPKANFHLCNR